MSNNPPQQPPTELITELDAAFSKLSNNVGHLSGRHLYALIRQLAFYFDVSPAIGLGLAGVDATTTFANFSAPSSCAALQNILANYSIATFNTQISALRNAAVETSDCDTIQAASEYVEVKADYHALR